MKKFSEIREAKKKMPPGEHVFDTKISGISVMVHKIKNKFVTYVDNDKLDTFRDLNTAKRAGAEFVKQYKA
jgi:hypothetical protein|tara:strand:+ start:10553 stop:10765 length:213 start_codon:yes stop_codon:yes gene_type:complete